MADDTVQATNPAITGPVTLDSEALKSTDVSNLDRLNAIYPKLAKATGGDGSKPRGRPKGSKNKSTLEREASQVSSPRDTRTPTQRMYGSRQASSTTTPKADELTPQQRSAAKHARVNEIADKISEGFNDNIAMVLSSMGMPTEAIYKPGREPKRVADSSPYTEFVGQILISPGQAEMWAKFLTELEQTELAKKLTGSAEGNSNVAMLVYGAGSILMAMQYLQGVSTFYKQMKPLLDQMKAMKLEQEAKENSNGQ